MMRDLSPFLRLSDFHFRSSSLSFSLEVSTFSPFFLLSLIVLISVTFRLPFLLSSYFFFFSDTFKWCNKTLLLVSGLTWQSIFFSSPFSLSLSLCLCLLPQLTSFLSFSHALKKKNCHSSIFSRASKWIRRRRKEEESDSTRKWPDKRWRLKRNTFGKRREKSQFEKEKEGERKKFKWESTERRRENLSERTTWKVTGWIVCNWLHLKKVSVSHSHLKERKPAGDSFLSSQNFVTFLHLLQSEDMVREGKRKKESERGKEKREKENEKEKEEFCFQDQEEIYRKNLFSESQSFSFILSDWVAKNQVIKTPTLYLTH